MKKIPPMFLKNPQQIKDLNYLNDLAVQKIEEGNYQEAINLFLEIIKKYPSYFLAYYNLGNLYMSLEEFNQAIFYFERGISIDNEHAKTYLGLAICYGKIGKKQLATDYFQKAYQLDPSLKNIPLPIDLFNN